MERAQDTITWQQWAKSKAVEPKVRDRRVALLNELAKCNGKNSPTELLDDIYADKITPYSAALAYVDAQIEKGLKPGTVRQYRSMLPNFFKAVLGERNFSQNPRNDDLLNWLDWVARSRKKFVDRQWVSGSLEVDVEARPRWLPLLL